jgi:gamma-tubulin complex component 3
MHNIPIPTLLYLFCSPYLNRPASDLYTHQLTPLLDSAIRTTNAQYEEQDVLARLDVKLMQMSPGELGWDVFTLQYCVDGPIAMVSWLIIKMYSLYCIS